MFNIGRALRKRRAKRFDIVFEERDFWPPFYSIMRKNQYRDGIEVLQRALYDAKIGDVIPLLEGEGFRHHYKVCGRWRKPGSDWGHISNLSFHVHYVKSEPVSEGEADG